MFRILTLIIAITFLYSCQNSDDGYTATDGAVLAATFGNKIDIDAPLSYRNTGIPAYIRYVNNGNNIENDKATLGRVLFYDKQLSVNNSISCASCHQQEHAFSDTSIASAGVNGMTSRHSMRLVNVGFQEGTRYFWNERASSLENQVLQPIKDHLEMGFSGESGAPSFDELLVKLSQLPYYPIIFTKIYGDANITTERIEESLAQFVRSIQSFDSKFDAGFTATGNLSNPFPNYTMSENRGKMLFNTLPANGGAGCVSCHAAPEFAIKNDIHNNGIIASLSDPSVFDHDNTRSPSLRDLTNPTGVLNGPLMHNGSFNTLQQMIAHYDNISMSNQILLDPLLFQSTGPGGPVGQQLNLSTIDKVALANFLKTLSGNDIYSNPKWSNPFIN